MFLDYRSYQLHGCPLSKQPQCSERQRMRLCVPVDVIVGNCLQVRAPTASLGGEKPMSVVQYTKKV